MRAQNPAIVSIGERLEKIFFSKSVELEIKYQVRYNPIAMGNEILKKLISLLFII